MSRIDSAKIVFNLYLDFTSSHRDYGLNPNSYFLIKRNDLPNYYYITT